MSFRKFLSEFRRNRRLAEKAKRTPLPEPSYDSIFEFVRQSSFGWVKDNSAIKPSDPLVGDSQFGGEDISYFIAEIQERLGLNISRSEWEQVGTFGEMTQLLAKYWRGGHHHAHPRDYGRGGDS